MKSGIKTKMKSFDQAVRGGWHLDRRVPLALILAIILQTFTAVWWASAQAQLNDFQDTHLGRLDIQLEKAAAGQELSGVRLARIEERVGAVQETLQRIEKNLGRR
ncbi:MAG: hypothetical protein GC131_09105 [Alphaproteobacteria bacterium]|nr:hypothetical protein [Alphaproteobacteria bacterium]